VFGCVLLGAGLLAATNYSTFARLAGRGTTLTGRTILWRSVSEAILDAPWLGHGYRAYFHKGAPAESETRHAMESQMQGERPEAAIVPEASPDVPLQVEWRLFHSHNGFLEVALDLGIPALALLLASLGFQVWPALRRVARGTAQEADVAHLGWLAALVVHNITEVSFLRGWHPEGLLWYLALASAPPRYSPDEIRALAPESRR
jgi:O-antigen ligase